MTRMHQDDRRGAEKPVRVFGRTADDEESQSVSRAQAADEIAEQERLNRYARFCKPPKTIAEAEALVEEFGAEKLLRFWRREALNAFRSRFFKSAYTIARGIPSVLLACQMHSLRQVVFQYADRPAGQIFALVLGTRNFMQSGGSPGDVERLVEECQQYSVAMIGDLFGLKNLPQNTCLDETFLMADAGATQSDKPTPPAATQEAPK